MYYYSKNSPDKGIQERNKLSVFKKRHMNTLVRPDSSKDDSLEKWYADNFDDPFASLVDRYESIMRVNQFPEPSQHERDFIVQFFYNHMKRTPDFHWSFGLENVLDGALAESLSEFERKFRNLTRAELERVRTSAFRDRIKNNVRVQILSQQPAAILDRMAEFGFAIAVPQRTNKSFIISSQPVVRFTNDSNNDLNTGDVELWTAVTPRVAFGLLSRIKKNSFIMLPDRQVRHINVELFKQSVAIGSQSYDLLNSLISRR